MWTYPEYFDVIVLGGGHAGCEAAHAAAKMGASTLLLTMNLDTIGKMSCNPAIGGTAKGHMVREIDALGGIMGKIIDRSGIQYRMLNATKGPAVWAPRAQADRVVYQTQAKWLLENTPNLSIRQGHAEDLLVENGSIQGVSTKEQIIYKGRTVILSAGTFMQGMIHIGQTNYSGGRAGDAPSKGLSKSLLDLGFSLHRLKTGTPPRVHAKSIDFSQTEEQKGDQGVRFSYDEPEVNNLPQCSCYITYTSAKTKLLIEENIHLSPMYSGTIQGVGPRYCPSIEDKVKRFADKERHQIFLEPEGISTHEVYVNGISSSLPFSVQHAFIRTIPGLENAQVTRPAYAIEYDALTCGQISFSLEANTVSGLFFAGQINGTSGYEEAAGQGLLAGINAARKVQGTTPLLLKRSEAYIGVMIDDLVTKGYDEPYRMFTSRAEHRLVLRQDNADLRLRDKGFEVGLISSTQQTKLKSKKLAIAEALQRFEKRFVPIDGKSVSIAQLLKRPEWTAERLQDELAEESSNIPLEALKQVEWELKFSGYIKRQSQLINKWDELEEELIPSRFAFDRVGGLRREAQEKLCKIRPSNLGQASRIPGVSPADISVLLVALKQTST